MYADWKRFYQGRDIVKINLKRMTPIDVDEFLSNTMQEFSLKPKAFHNMCGLLKQMLRYTVDKGYIGGSPYRVDINKNDLIPDPKKLDVSDCANIKTHGFEVVEHTKTKNGDRWLPLTEKAKDTIHRIKETNMKYGEYYEGFLFVRNGYIMSPDVIDAQILAGCKQIGIRVKTMHKIRKTYGSTLLHGGINISIVKDLLGHASEATTYRSYIFNTMDAFETNNAVTAVLEKERTMTGDSEKGTSTVKKVTKSDQKIIPFSSKKKAETPGKSRISATK